MDSSFKKVDSVWIHSHQLISYALYHFKIELQKGNYKKTGTPPFNDKNYKKVENLLKKGGNLQNSCFLAFLSLQKIKSMFLAFLSFQQQQKIFKKKKFLSLQKIKSIFFEIL